MSDKNSSQPEANVEKTHHNNGLAEALQPDNHDIHCNSDDVVHNYRASSKPFRWLLVLCSSVVFTVVSITQVSFGIFITEIEHVFGLTHAMIGLIGSFRLSLSLGGGKCAIYNVNQSTMCSYMCACIHISPRLYLSYIFRY